MDPPPFNRIRLFLIINKIAVCNSYKNIEPNSTENDETSEKISTHFKTVELWLNHPIRRNHLELQHRLRSQKSINLQYLAKRISFSLWAVWRGGIENQLPSVGSSSELICCKICCRIRLRNNASYEPTTDQKWTGYHEPRSALERDLRVLLLLED